MEVTGSELDLREGTGHKGRKGFENPVSLLVQHSLFKTFYDYPQFCCYISVALVVLKCTGA